MIYLFSAVFSGPLEYDIRFQFHVPLLHMYWLGTADSFLKIKNGAYRQTNKRNNDSETKRSNMACKELALRTL